MVFVVSSWRYQWLCSILAEKGNLYLADGHSNLSTWVRQLQSEFSPSLLVAVECHVSGNGIRPSSMQISIMELISSMKRVVQGGSASKPGLEINLSIPTCNALSSS